MTFKIWIKILVVISVVVVPLTLSNHYLQKQSLSVLSRIHNEFELTHILDDHLELLKQMAEIQTNRREELHRNFQKTLETKIAAEDFAAVEDSIAKQITKQTLQLTLLVLFIALALSILFSKNIVNTFSKLHSQNLAQTKRLETMNTIESWQKLAKMLVHELRAPLTPLKLIAGDLNNKYHSLEPAQFDRYIREGSELMNDQISTVEKMVENFLNFARLPEVAKETINLSDLLTRFVDTYKDYAPGQLTLRCKAPPITVEMDPKLVTCLLFNLVKNAVEANPGRAIQIELNGLQVENMCSISVRNNGNTIPESMASKIFEPYVSSSSENKSNLGLGLTISKKIALDHSGDLYLKHNDPEHGVTFVFESPIGESCEA